MSETKMDGRSGDSLRGAAASLYLAMILHPGSHTPTSLEILTGYTFKPIRLALTTLSSEGLVRHDDLTGAWRVVPGTPLLCRLQQAMQEAGGAYAPGGWPARSFSREAREGGADHDDPGSGKALNRGTAGLSTEPPAGLETGIGETPEASGIMPVLSGEIPVRKDVRAAEPAGPRSVGGERPQSGGAWAPMIGISPETYGKTPQQGREVARGAGGVRLDAGGESPDAGGESPPIDGENSSIDGESPAASGENPAAGGESPISRARITTTTAPYPPDQQTASSKQAGKKRARASPQRSPDARVMAAWLERGGVGRYSPKMDELLARGLDLEVVQAHVLERLACEKGLVSGQPNYTPGLLVRKLEDGDPPPPMRCPKCLSLRRQSSLGWCDCQLEAMISR